MSKISQEHLKELFHYNPLTGAFQWRGGRRKGLPALCSPTKQGYLTGKVPPCGTQRAHRMAFLYAFGYLPDEIDHINGDKKDNRAANLRSVSHRENTLNQPMRRATKSGALGVTLISSTGRWRSRVSDGSKRVHLGVFDSLEDAISARRDAEAALNYHPNHSRVNPYKNDLVHI